MTPLPVWKDKSMHFSCLNCYVRSSWFSRTTRLVFLAFCFCLLVVTAFAQTFSSITGTVTAASGAVVEKANINIENIATHVFSQTVTNPAGSYVIADLLPGTYTVMVEKPGFQRRIISSVHVDVGRGTRADAQLSTGSVTDMVEVRAPAIALDTTQPQLGTIIENKITEEIPVLIGGGPGNQGPRDRQIDDYLFLAPGVSGGEWS